MANEGMGSRLLEVLGAIGGSAGLVYAVGYLVYAGHNRVLGLDAPLTDTSTLLLGAFEFLIRGTLYTILSCLQFLMRATVLYAGGFAVLLWMALLVGRRMGFGSADKLWRRGTRWAMSHQRQLRAVAIVIVFSAQAYHVMAHIIPAASITALLSTGAEPVVPPFPSLLPGAHAFLERHWNELRLAIVGNGYESDGATLSRLFVVHLAICVLTSCAALLIWQRCRHVPSAGAGKTFSLIALVNCAILTMYTPMYYGVTMKSYRYSRVQLTPTETSPADGDFSRMTRRPEFLLRISESDYILYNEQFREIHFVKRDLVAIAKITADDFLFPRNQ